MTGKNWEVGEEQGVPRADSVKPARPDHLKEPEGSGIFEGFEPDSDVITFHLQTSLWRLGVHG